MTAQVLVELLRAEPFRPFRIVTADGARHRVDAPESLATAGGRAVVFIDADDRVHLLDAGMIARIEVEPEDG